MPPPFLPRLTFTYPNAFASWHPGHMTAFMTELSNRLPDIDMVIECRDARLPLTSINPKLEAAVDAAWGANWREGKGKLTGRKREKLIVYTKRDLAESKYEEHLISGFRKYANQNIMFATANDRDDVKRVLKKAVNFAKENYESLLDMKVLVVGMPNVGKSTISNQLRNAGLKKGKHFQTSTTAGHTRNIGSRLKIYEDPPIYVMDTPGAMPPWLGSGDEAAERAFGIAATGGIKNSLYSDESLVDYLLYKLNLRAVESETAPLWHHSRVVPFKYGLPYSKELYTQTNDVDEFLHRLGRRIGALRQGGFIDLPRAATFFLNKFRTGKLGRWTLDDLELRNDLYRDPLFSFYPELLATSPSLDGSLAGTKPPTALDLAEKHHMSLLLPPERTTHPDIKFNPANPPWAPPISEDEEEVRLAKLAPSIQVPTDLKAKVHEAVRRYFWSKKERDEAISETQKKKLISDARKRKSQQIGENRRLERLYAAGIRPRALPRVPRVAPPIPAGLARIMPPSSSSENP